MVPRLFLCVPLLLVSCGTVHDWRELRTDPMTIGEAYDGIEVVGGADFVPDKAVCDRGLGIWQSRWRMRLLERNYPGRCRLRVEILADEGSAATGWPIRFAVEQQIVEDLRYAASPREEDWDDTTQDKEKEAILGERLLRRLAPKSVVAPPRREQPKLPGT
ncbi:MAG: hypothetical protein JNK15_15360 [Planctomycetes bacterium]|nr:hypothetical protein [Planctomycetota bacterium]